MFAPEFGGLDVTFGGSQTSVDELNNEVKCEHSTSVLILIAKCGTFASSTTEKKKSQRKLELTIHHGHKDDG